MNHWKTIPGLPEYEASDSGQIRSKARSITIGHGPSSHRRIIPGKVMTQTWIYRNGRPGYLMVKVNGQSLLVHRLVALAWLTSTHAPGLEVNHKDGNKHNNHVANLEWVTHSENERHSYRVLGKGKRHA